MIKKLLPLLILLLSSCVSTPAPDKLVLSPADFSDLKGWDDDTLEGVCRAMKRSCEKLSRLPEGYLFGQEQFGDVSDWKESCRELQQMDDENPAALKDFLEARFIPYQVKNNHKVTGLFTGYYEPALRGSLTRHGKYQYPVYRLPADVKAGTPYFSRREIEQGAIAGKGLELAYVDDPVELFFLHIQGSGRIQLDNGQVLRVGYAGKNNREYIALGKVLAEGGYIPKDKITAESIKHWLYTHPDMAVTLMDMNPSYVFFRKLDGQNPIGGQGVELTEGRSLAVDKAFLPYGVPVWLETAVPAQYARGGQRFHRLMVAQDTGGAIKGPVRGDIFFGFGEEAERLASHMQNKGGYYLLLPKKGASQVAYGR